MPDHLEKGLLNSARETTGYHVPDHLGKGYLDGARGIDGFVDFTQKCMRRGRFLNIELAVGSSPCGSAVPPIRAAGGGPCGSAIWVVSTDMGASTATNSKMRRPRTVSIRLISLEGPRTIGIC